MVRSPFIAFLRSPRGGFPLQALAAAVAAESAVAVK